MQNKTLTCDICGAEFVPSNQIHYVVRDLRRVGFAAAISSTDEAQLYDAFDCPSCGCQVIAQSRKRLFNPIDDLIDEEDLLDALDSETIANYLGLETDVVENLRKVRNGDDEDEDGGYDPDLGFNPYI